MELSVQNVYGLVIRSRLLSPEEARTMFERWQAEAKDGSANVADFARWMVASQYLTEYQATLLARGHADGFFLNQYKVLDRLGRGRMAGVYKAVHRLGQVVAIKVLPPSKAKDPQLLARFQREARLSMKLQHPNVVRTFQIGETGGLYYLVMECLEGETLDDVIQRRKKLPPSEAVRIVYQALLALEHLHERGMVHRDIKPANLMIVPSGSPAGPPDTTFRSTVKVLDMSLGRALSDESMDEDPGQHQLTAEGTLLGTPDYMAPEQARDAHAADIRADIYSLGGVLYHLIAGQPPFPDSNIISQMIRHATEEPKPLKAFNPAVPDGLQQIIGWMMAKDPAKRYPTPERAAQALQVFLAAEAAPLANPEAEARMRSFLTWLEMDDEKPAPAAKPPAPAPAAAPTVPVAVPVAAVAGAVAPPPAPPPAKPAPDRHPSKKAKPQPAKAPEPAVPVAASPADSFDVELLPTAPPPSQAGLAGFLAGVRRRDFAFMGVGAAGVLVAIFIGWVVAKLAGH
jgi:serine/threonine protein kinase